MSFLLTAIIAGLLLIVLGLFFIIFGIVKKMKGYIIVGCVMIILCVLGVLALLHLITSM